MQRGFCGNLIFANFCHYCSNVVRKSSLQKSSQMVVFQERGNRSTWRKPLGADKRTNKLNPHLTPDLGIELGPHWLVGGECSIPSPLATASCSTHIHANYQALTSSKHALERSTLRTTLSTVLSSIIPLSEGRCLACLCRQVVVR